jgi:hypothetical protein
MTPVSAGYVSCGLLAHWVRTRNLPGNPACERVALVEVSMALGGRAQ